MAVQLDPVNRDHLAFLSQVRRRFCVSLFLPTHRAGKEILQDSIRLKNLLKDAEKQLLANGFTAVEARELLAPLRPLAQRRSFWRLQSDGLAVFLSPGFFHYFRLLLNFQE